MDRRLVVLPTIVVLAAAAVWVTQRSPTIVVPAVQWRVGPVDDQRPARNFDDLPPDTRVRLWLRCDEPRHVYVFSHSAEDGTLLLHPSPDVRGSVPQPLPAGEHVLPGELDGRLLAWTTRVRILATTVFVVVAAREPVAELEALAPRLRRWTNMAMTDGSMQVTAPAAGMALAGGPGSPLPAPVLQRAAEAFIAETIVNGPLRSDPARDGVWFGAWRVREQPEKR